MRRKTLNTFLALFGMLLPGAFAGETTTLAEMLAKVRKDPEATLDTRPLARDWIGDVTDNEGKIERLRLEKGRIIKGEVVLLRTYPNGNCLGSDAPSLVKSIPSNERLRKCTTLAELESALGPGQPSFDGWGGPEVMHRSHSWVCFSPTADDRLTYVSVFAHTSFTENQRAKGITQVDELLISRGELRPADPDSRKEREIYLSGADVFAAEEAQKERGRQHYPQPLRDLIRVDDHPNDSDLKLLSAAVQAIRNDPDPKLFAQLAQVMHEDPVKINSLLRHILMNEHDSLDLKPWGDKEEAIAVDACIDALPLAQEDGRDDLIETLLHLYGGGRIEIEGENGGTSIQVKIAKDGSTLTRASATHPLSLGDAQQELRRLFAKSKAPKGAGAQPAGRRKSK